MDFEPLHRPAARVLHREAQASQLVIFTSARHVPHGVRDQATDGVKLVV